MLRVYCDFDGTVATHDVGNLLFRKFAGDRTLSIVREYLNGSINARECLARECRAVGAIARTDLEAYIDGFGLDDGFAPFVEFCKNHDFPLVILSDGLDFYVSRLLKNAGLGYIRFFANQAIFSAGPDNRETLAPAFPYRDEHCERCGNCKRNHLAVLSADEDVVVYVGDGISDRCPVAYADIVFAKKDLIKYCQQQNISYYEYRNFTDVQARLAGLMEAGKPKQRREAMMARRELFIAE